MSQNENAANRDDGLRMGMSQQYYQSTGSTGSGSASGGYHFDYEEAVALRSEWAKVVDQFDQRATKIRTMQDAEAPSRDKPSQDFAAKLQSQGDDAQTVNTKMRAYAQWWHDNFDQTIQAYEEQERQAAASLRHQGQA